MPVLSTAVQLPNWSVTCVLVNVHTQDILSGNQIILLQNVPISVAANVCGLTTNVLSNQLLSKNYATCVAKTNAITKSWVSYAN